MTLILAKSHLAAINAHCEAAYPDEGCGAMLGSIDGDVRTVSDVVALANAGDTRGDWFEIDPADLLGLERRARTEKSSVLGFFHSHPDALCRPSARDLERAWPFYAYVIVTVAAGSAGEIANWTLTADGKAFENEPIQMKEEHN